MTPEDVQLFYQTAILGRRDLPLAPDPRAGFRMTLLRMLAFRPAAAGASQAVVAGGGTVASTPRLPATSSPAATSVAAESPTTAPLGDWGQILSALDLQGAARQLAANCALLDRQGDLLRLALDPRSSLVRTRAQEEKLAQALSRHFGTAIRIDIAVREAPAESPARERERQAQQHLEQARTAFAGDATVQSLQQRFGATIHPDSVRPAKPS
jgi:DNA polymerase-3 subunit gamma/tau